MEEVNKFEASETLPLQIKTTFRIPWHTLQKTKEIHNQTYHSENAENTIGKAKHLEKSRFLKINVL